MRFLFVGDVCGRTGRMAFAKYTPKLRREYAIDVVIVNGENIAGGRGISRKTLDELYRAGADIVTSGNHIWDNKEIYEFIDDEPFLVRPANYPDGALGKGYCLYPFRSKVIGVMNLSGRVFMPSVDCPFQKVEEILREIKGKADILILDFHAEATSEKMSMGWYLDGRVQIVVGTHTHIQTADECVLPQGTAYLTDLGMVGATNSVLGMEKEGVLEKFLTCRPVRFKVAEGSFIYSSLFVDIDEEKKKIKKLERILIREDFN